MFGALKILGRSPIQEASRYAAKRAAWDADPAALAEQRRKWREAFRRRMGLPADGLPNAEFRAGQKAARDAKAAERAAEKIESDAAREVDRLTRPTPRERNRAWRTANPARARGLVRSWKLAHPDEVRAAKCGRHIAKRAATIEILSKAQRGRCAICHCRLGDEVHIDHIMPKALGGSNRRSNLQLTCAPCNMAKGPRHPLDHARSLGLLL